MATAGKPPAVTPSGQNGRVEDVADPNQVETAVEVTPADAADPAGPADQTPTAADEVALGPGLNPAQQQVLDELGSTDRPVFRDDLRADLLRYLEEELGPVAGRAEEPLFLSKHQLGLLHGCEARFVADRSREFAWTVASARGSVAHKAIELMITHRNSPTPLDLVERAVERIEDDELSLGGFIRTLDEGQRAELTSRSNDFVTTFVETFPPLQRQWKPVAEYSLRALLCQDRITLRGKVDLSLGSIRRGREAGKVLIDLKTGQPGHGHLEDLRFYALLETLKMGVPPRLLVNYYLDAGTPRPEVVSEELLWSAARRVVDGVTILGSLTGSEAREPAKNPGMNCRWCPINEDCDEGRRHLDGAEEDGW